MVKLFIGLLVVAVCFYVGILYQNIQILLCGGALGLLLLISFMEIIYRLFTTKIKVEIPITMAEQNQPVDIGIRVKNKSHFPTGKVKCLISIHNSFAKVKKKEWIAISSAYSGSYRYNFPIVIQEAGCQEIELLKVRFYSMLGLFSFTRHQKSFGNVVVMPEVHPMAIRITEPVRNFLGDADVYDDIRPGHDPSEVFEVREYRPKDRIQKIHWKLSAKMDDLMVKENSLPVACAVVLMLEPKAISDGYFEVVASLSYALMDEKCAHYIAWYSKEKKEVIRIRVDDEESFYLFLNCYLLDGTIIEDINIRESYRDKYRSEYYLYDLLINQDLEIYKNGELVHKVNKKNIADECEKMEILL